VYYGEEIGMTGTKPDERLRTPMPWTAARGAGFTTATPWQRMADDSAQVTVASQDRDPASLLNLHRRLIHFRSAHPAMGTDSLLPLQTSDGAATAYLRRAGNRAVLVVANLGSAPLSGATIASSGSVLPAGRWRLRDVLGRERAAALTVDADGRIAAQSPLPVLAGVTGWVFELERLR
jgi:glycosidase